MVTSRKPRLSSNSGSQARRSSPRGRIFGKVWGHFWFTGAATCISIKTGTKANGCLPLESSAHRATSHAYRRRAYSKLALPTSSCDPRAAESPASERPGLRRRVGVVGGAPSGPGVPPSAPCPHARLRRGGGTAASGCLEAVDVLFSWLKPVE